MLHFAMLYPVSDAEFLHWLENFAEVCDDNRDELGITPADVAELTALHTDLKTKREEATRALNEAKAAVTAKDEARDKANRAASFRAQMFKVNPRIPDELKFRLRIGVRKRRTVAKPDTPTQVVAQESGFHTNKIAWDRGSNSRTTTFVVESRPFEGGEYAVVGATTKTHFVHRFDGEPIARLYRVLARRGDRESDFSEPTLAGNL